MATIESVGRSSAWIDFMKTAEAARRRNAAGFTPATTPSRTGLPVRHVANDNGQPVASARTSPLASKLYGTAEPQVRTTGVGKLFDAYA